MTLQDELIRDYEQSRTAWMWSDELPDGYPPGSIWHIRGTRDCGFDESHRPIVLKGSRDRMWLGYRNPDRAAIEKIFYRCARRFKLTILSGDAGYSPRSASGLRFAEWKKFVSAFNDKFRRRYPNQRFDVMEQLFGPSIIAGKQVYLEQESLENMRKILDTMTRTLANLDKLERLVPVA